ncbi:MAG TPA: CopD family protein [Candidatus Acidoferrum sp.]|nr:CopD family protein [Candidatus Acidoferrum sp.]
MDRLLNIFGYLAVLLRAATLCFQTLTIGGIVFVTVVTRSQELRTDAVVNNCRKWIMWFALALAATQVFYVASNTLILMQSADMAFNEAIGANFVYAGALAAISGLLIAAACAFGKWRGNAALLLPALAILASALMTSHSVARMDHRVLLTALTGLHQLATAAWIGGLPYLLISLNRESDPQVRRRIAANFSQLALFSVALLFAGGFGLSLAYVGSWSALYGTTYGVMVSTKIIMFGFLLLLGALNFFIVRNANADATAAQISADPGARPTSLLRFGEVEIGIGLTIILAAASLTSQPPAVDLGADKVSAAEIFQRYAPRVPRLTSPPLSALSEPTEQKAKRAAANGVVVPASYVPGQAAAESNGPGDIAWSEYNHNWAGIIVLGVGLLSFLNRTGYFPWARHWPLVFLGLAVFLFLRSDPENWPLGPNGFWESFSSPDVLQHRVIVLLVTAFALFEWSVVTGRVKSLAAGLVFPGVCALGGAILLTHSHALGNVKDELLIELSHIPLAVLGIAAGWSRWLELRLPPEDRTRRILSWIWPVCFILVGLVLLDYHEA